MNVTILADHPLWSKCNLNVIFSDGYLIKCENLTLSEMLNIRRQKIHLDQLWQIWHREAILERVRDRVHNWFNLFLDLSLSSLDFIKDFDILDNFDFEWCMMKWMVSCFQMLLIFLDFWTYRKWQRTSESFDFILFAMCHVIKLRSKRPFRNIHLAWKHKKKLEVNQQCIKIQLKEINLYTNCNKIGRIAAKNLGDSTK